MGLILCDKHGPTGVINHISEDICEKVISDDPLKREDIKVVLIDLYDEEEYLFTITNYISADLFAKYELREKYVIRNEEEEEALDRKLPKLGALCGMCFKAYLIKNGIDLF